MVTNQEHHDADQPQSHTNEVLDRDNKAYAAYTHPPVPHIVESAKCATARSEPAKTTDSAILLQLSLIHI